MGEDLRPQGRLHVHIGVIVRFGEPDVVDGAQDAGNAGPVSHVSAICCTRRS